MNGRRLIGMWWEHSAYRHDPIPLILYYPIFVRFLPEGLSVREFLVMTTLAIGYKMSEQ